MTICQAYKIVNQKGITPWMAHGVIKFNDGYAIVDAQFLKRFPDTKLIYLRKGENFPKEPLFPFYNLEL